MNDLSRRTPSLRPHLVPLISAIEARRLPARSFDVVVVGAGVAGLAFALRLAPEYRVALLTKGVLGESNTRWAQGGLSAAIGSDDSPAIHEQDTLAAGAGLCDAAAVHELVEGAPDAVEWLLSVGTRFDRNPDSGELLLGREAAHARRRVLHAGGDATGAEIERSLVAAAKLRPSIEIFEGAFAVDLVREDDRIIGLVAETATGEALTLFESNLVVIAAGGAGRLWATTSNPRGATADGLAMALRNGVPVADVEFTQFHPTVITLPNGEAFLISEAVRGEGAYLRGAAGERFMVALHPMAELAPRDVVARGIQRQMALDHADHVYLDLRHLNAEAMHARFPTISEVLRSHGLDLARDLLPVAPAAHYFMGGIVAATDGETAAPGLLALGEAACTGVHGANRLASNSLLEGLVFGIAAADRINRIGLNQMPPSLHAGSITETACVTCDETDELKRRIQTAMSRDVAVIRNADGLNRAESEIEAVLDRAAGQPLGGRSEWELRNVALAARAIVAAAAIREESRGAHFRSDFPELDPDLDGQHLSFDGDVWRFESLESARLRQGATR
jgi:L-aspartate oxidase